MDSATGIAFLGGGNMARALIGGLLAAGHRPSAIRVHDVDPDKGRALQAELGVSSVSTAPELLPSAALVLAVKPQQMREALGFLAAGPGGESAPVLISIAAGLRLEALSTWSGNGYPVVRCMPNTPALVGCGASVLCADARTRADQKELAGAILDAVGTVHWVDEEAALDAVTAISGSGPAYFFLLQELLQEGAEALGLDQELARDLVRQTALGAAQLAAAASEPVGQLRRNVTSPGGTTERALQVFQQSGLGDIVRRATQAAHARSRELSEELAS